MNARIHSRVLFRTHAEAGFSMLYVIAVIMALATLATGLMNMTSTGTITELNEAFTTRARYIALSGFNYARQFREDYGELEGVTVTLSDTERFSFSDYRQFQDAAGEMRIAMKVTGTTGAGSGHEANYVLYTDFLAEDQGVISQPKDSESFGTLSSDPSKQPVVKDDEKKNFTIGNNQYNAFGAYYYKGTKTLNWGHNECVDGYCDFKEGIRLFFVSYYDKNDADGIVFTIFNGANNTTDSIGGDSVNGEMIGYAADGRIYDLNFSNWTYTNVIKWLSPNRLGIQPPKIGIEFDNYRNASAYPMCTNADAHPSTSVRADHGSGDPAHIAYVFWGLNNKTDIENYLPYHYDCAYCRKGTNTPLVVSNTNNGAKAFDGITQQNSSNSAVFNNTGSVTMYIGRDLGKCKQAVTKWEAWGSTDRGFSESASPDITICLVGSNSNTASSAALVPGSCETFPDSNGKFVEKTFSNSTNYQYYWLRVQGPGRLYVAEAQFKATYSTFAGDIQAGVYDPYGPTGNCDQRALWGGVLGFDDNMHGMGYAGYSPKAGMPAFTDTAVGNSPNAAQNEGYWTAQGWVAKKAFAFRAEVERSLTAVTSGPHTGKYAYHITSWFRPCNNAHCLQYVQQTGSSQVETDMAYFSDTSRFLCRDKTLPGYQGCTVDNPPILDQTVYLTQEQHDQFDKMIFGFTEATGGATQTATYSYFTLQFLKPNDYDTSTTPVKKRRLIDRKIICPSGVSSNACP